MLQLALSLESLNVKDQWNIEEVFYFFTLAVTVFSTWSAAYPQLNNFFSGWSLVFLWLLCALGQYASNTSDLY